MTYNSFDIVVVSFPFTDSAASKRRPALVLSSSISFNQRIGHSVLAMITSAKNAPWPLDVNIEDLKKANLTNPSVIRMKFFTLDHRLILEKIGTLSKKDRIATIEAVNLLLKDVYVGS